MFRLRTDESFRPGVPQIPSIDPKTLRRRVKAANTAGLRYVTDQMPGITREHKGQGFRYRYATGDIVTDEQVLKRIKSLAIPPAWTNVWICPDPCGHLQATGRDARGRKQSRYHPRWREVRDENKYSRMIAFGRALPRIRRAAERDLRNRGLTRRKVLAAVVRLLELSLIRVGNQEYARHNDSFGLTTMRDRHVAIKGSALRFSFRGKSGKRHQVAIEDQRLARIVKDCQDLPGQELFQYEDDEGQRRSISSEDVNEYLRQITGADFTAKDFRTWAGTVMTAVALRDLQPCETQRQVKRHLNAAVCAVAERLGNTPSVCRKCYIHPHIISAYMDSRGEPGHLLGTSAGKAKRGLHPDETAVLALLRKQLAAERKREHDPAAQFAATLERLKGNRRSSVHNSGARRLPQHSRE